VVNLTVLLEGGLKRIRNVVGRIPGNGSEALREVILGAHRDAWVFGAADPSSYPPLPLPPSRAFPVAER
jgi:hypothetical protein